MTVGWWNIRCKAVDVAGDLKTWLVESRCRRGPRAPPRVADANCQEKLRGPGMLLTVPQTDTGRRGEQPKGLE